LPDSLNPSCGLPKRVFDEWKRKNFQLEHEELSNFRQPQRDKNAVALILYLKKNRMTVLQTGLLENILKKIRTIHTDI